MRRNNMQTKTEILQYFNGPPFFGDSREILQYFNPSTGPSVHGQGKGYQEVLKYLGKRGEGEGYNIYNYIYSNNLQFPRSAEILQIGPLKDLEVSPRSLAGWGAT